MEKVRNGLKEKEGEVEKEEEEKEGEEEKEEERERGGGGGHLRAGGHTEPAVGADLGFLLLGVGGLGARLLPVRPCRRTEP